MQILGVKPGSQYDALACVAYARQIVNRIHSQRFNATQRDASQRMNRINFYSCVKYARLRCI